MLYNTIMFEQLKTDRKCKIIGSLFILLSLSWLILFIGSRETTNNHLIWAASYQVLAILGGFWGITIARGWGGMKSLMGTAIYAFSIGLLMQSFGQTSFSFYNLALDREIPYPSIADLGFFGSIPVYIFGIIQLAKASGAKVSLKSFGSKIQALFIPLLMLVLSYYFFLRGYEFDWETPLRVFLDFAYPFGQAIYVSIAILTYLLSKKILGGLMRVKILFILSALVVQYLADYNFLYQAINGTWYNGGYGDYIYLLAYFIMALSLLNLKLDYIRKT